MTPRVYQWMRRDLRAVRPDEPAIAAAELMAELRIRHVLVTDDAGRLVGIVSNRDLIRATLHDPEARLDLHGVEVRKIMTPTPLSTVHPHAPLSAAAGEMARRKISALPVVVRGRLTGLITSHDLLLAWEAPSLSVAPALQVLQEVS